MTAEPGPGQSRKPGDGEPSDMAPVRLLRRLNRWLVEGLREDLADLYVESRVTAPGDAYRRPSRQNFLDRLTTDMRRPGFAMVIAEMDRLMGRASDVQPPPGAERSGGCTIGPVHQRGAEWFRRPASPATFRALLFPVGERTTARMEGLVTMPGGGGPGGP